MSVDSPNAARVGHADAAPRSDAAGAIQLATSLGDQLRHSPIVVAVSGEADGAAPLRVASALEHQYRRADLIAIGSLRHERLERWILGSVTTEIVRDGRCSVLVVPPPSGA